jgi:hypothetical protein
MKKFNNYKIQKEDINKQREKGRYNPATELTYKLKNKTYTVTLSCGSNDGITVYREGEELYVLTTNYNLGYCGLEIVNSGIIVGDVFFQNPTEELIKNWENKADYTLIRCMLNYIY